MSVSSGQPGCSAGWFERGMEDRVAEAVDGRFTARTGSEMQLPEFVGEVERSMGEGCGRDGMGCGCLVRGRRAVFVNFSSVPGERRRVQTSCGPLPGLLTPRHGPPSLPAGDWPATSDSEAHTERRRSCSNTIPPNAPQFAMDAFFQPSKPTSRQAASSWRVLATPPHAMPQVSPSRPPSRASMMPLPHPPAWCRVQL